MLLENILGSEAGVINSSIIISILGILFAIWQIRNVLKVKVLDQKVLDIQSAIKEGADAYMLRQYSVVSIVAVVIFVILIRFFGFPTALGFVLGGLASAVSGFLGMNVAVRANAKVAKEAERGLAMSLKLAFQGGSVTGFLVASLSLLTVAVFYYFVGKPYGMAPMAGLAFGSSLISVFARLGGGIYTKAADVGTDMVGKIEAGIPEDDPRNPGVIADNVGDNVGDCAGMAADLFETYVVTLVSTMLLGTLLFGNSWKVVTYPLALGAVAILASVVGSFFVKLGRDQDIMNALYKALFASTLVCAIAFYPLTMSTLVNVPGINPLNLYFCTLTGLLVTLILVFITDFYTAKRFGAVAEIAKASVSGHGTNIIAGLAISMKSTFIPVLCLSLAMLFSYSLAGIFGVGAAAMGMLSLTGIIVAIDSFGPITDNAGGIAEMSNLSPEIRKITDALDAVGNTTKAVTKGYAIGTAVLSALVIFATFTQELLSRGSHINFLLSDPKVLVGLFVGGSLPYLFASITMQAVGSAAAAIVEEIRRQFREIKGLMDGVTKPQYGRAVDIVTKAALGKMIVPALIPVVSPIIVGFVLGPAALGGMILGTIVTGVFLAISMTTGGAAWDNAKKYIESGNFGGKGSQAHQAAVTGDTVGDPYKDTAGPAINPMIKIINIVALLIIPFII
jgi:K(+)-stimulated pyrophosphate-energized sodium pump